MQGIDFAHYDRTVVIDTLALIHCQSPTLFRNHSITFNDELEITLFPACFFTTDFVV